MRLLNLDSGHRRFQIFSTLTFEVEMLNSSRLYCLQILDCLATLRIGGVVVSNFLELNGHKSAALVTALSELAGRSLSLSRARHHRSVGLPLLRLRGARINL